MVMQHDFVGIGSISIDYNAIKSNDAGFKFLLTHSPFRIKVSFRTTDGPQFASIME